MNNLFFLITSIFILPLFAISAPAQTSPANALVQFLAGKWDNVSFEISSGFPIKKESYSETMLVKNKHTLTITAHGYKDGKDLTKDMRLDVVGDTVTMSQGSFKATGKREDAVYSMTGFAGDSEFRFRLYTLGDKYVFHRETWKSGKIQQVDMSYLVRK